MQGLSLYLVITITGSIMFGAEVEGLVDDINLHLDLGELTDVDIGQSKSVVIQRLLEALAPKRKVYEGTNCQGCFSVGSQTFVAYPTKTGSWDDAKAFCERDGFRLPEPNDPNQLSKMLRERIKGVTLNYFWAGARGDGTRFKWLSGGSLDTSSKWWWSGHPGGSVAKANCLGVVVHDNPNDHSTFVSTTCTGRYNFICEKV